MCMSPKCPAGCTCRRHTRLRAACPEGCTCKKHSDRPRHAYGLEFREKLRAAADRSPCPSDCTCWKHAPTGHVCADGCKCGRHRIPPCKPGCTCGKHTETGPGYSANHKKVVRRRGAARNYVCVDCGAPAREWSHIHGTDGRDPMVHYAPRCIPCHKEYDR